MARITRRGGQTPRPPRSRSGPKLERLEQRQLLSGFNDDYIASLLYRRGEAGLPAVDRAHPLGDSPALLAQFSNQGKVISGRTAAGDEYVITVHGPGVAIVTDTSPNDGLLDAEIDTIQLVGTDLHRTVVTGQVKASDRIITDGTVGFNRLIAEDGVATIDLDGFVLEPTGPVSSGAPRIALLGGVKRLSFHAIDGAFDTGATVFPIEVTIGDPTTPLTVRPDIRIDHIFNTAFDTTTGFVPDVPQTDPTVVLTVNGQIRNLELVSATASPMDAGTDARVSPVSYTGRTAVRTFGIDGLKVVGSARNFTASRTEQPFASRFSGLDRLGHAAFGGNADAVALDVSNGPIGRLRFLRGLGNPTGTRDSLLFAGIPNGERGYPAAGLQGGVVAAREIGGENQFGAADLFLQIPPDPADIQSRGTGTVNFARRPGAALTNATVASAGSIGATTVVGNLRNSLIASGFDYPAFVRGLDPVRSPSSIGPFIQRGDMVDGVVAASYRSVDGVYGDANDLAGNGRIRGDFLGRLFLSGDQDINIPPTTGGPGVRGAGFFARFLEGRLPNISGSNL